MSDRPDIHDVQELSDADMSVYEAVASLAVDGRTARLRDMAEMTDRPEDDVRRSLAHLVDSGWVVRKGDGYALGPHDWEVEY